MYPERLREASEIKCIYSSLVRICADAALASSAPSSFQGVVGRVIGFISRFLPPAVNIAFDLVLADRRSARRCSSADSLRYTIRATPSLSTRAWLGGSIGQSQ